MDPHIRNLEEEELLEDIIKDGPDVEPAESPSSYLNQDVRSSDTKMKPMGQERGPMTEKVIAPLMEKPVKRRSPGRYTYEVRQSLVICEKYWR